MPKTREIIVLKSNYGYGWNDEITYEKDEKAEAKADFKSYRENCPSRSFKLIHRRIKNTTDE